MANSRGRNAGITGLIDLPGIGGGVKFQARFYGYKKTLSIASKSRRGRGDTGKWARSRPILSSGSFACSGKMRLDAPPLPDDWRGQEGTATLTYATGKTETVPIRVDGMSSGFKEESEDLQDISLSCTIMATPTYAGFGAAPAATDPAKSDQVQYEGSSKTLDPQGLQSTAIVLIDLWGSLADTDAAEETRLTDAIAAATAPMAGMKKRTGQFARDSDDGATLVLIFGLTDTAEDVVNPITRVSIDPRKLASEATGAAINATPATPSGAAYKLRSSSTQELNDGHILQTSQFALSDTKDDVELGGTYRKADPFMLEPAAAVTVQSDQSVAPTPPSPTVPGSVYIDTLTRELVPGQYSHTHLFGPRTTADDVIFPHYWMLLDPGDLDSEGEVAAIGSTPDVPAGYYNRGVTNHRLTNTGLILYVMKFGRRSTVQDLEMEHSGSEGTPFEGTETRVATVISNTNSTAIIAAANFSTGTNFASVSARRLNDDKALLIKATRDNPRIVTFEMRSPGEEPVRGYVLAGVVYLYVRQIYQRANYWEYELAEQPLPLLRMRFGISRRQTGEPIDMLWGLAGSANSDSFLGLSAGAVAYRGINGRHNYTNGGPADIFHEYEYLLIREGTLNVTGHIYFGKANLGWHRTEHDLSAINPGTWVSANNLYELGSHFDSSPYPQVAYSGVLT